MQIMQMSATTEYKYEQGKRFKEARRIYRIFQLNSQPYNLWHWKQWAQEFLSWYVLVTERQFVRSWSNRIYKHNIESD
jgi:hypothetical protein